MQGGAQFSLTFSFRKANFGVNFRLCGLLSTQKLHKNCGCTTVAKESCTMVSRQKDAKKWERCSQNECRALINLSVYITYLWVLKQHIRLRAHTHSHKHTHIHTHGCTRFSFLKLFKRLSNENFAQQQLFANTYMHLLCMPLSGGEGGEANGRVVDSGRWSAVVMCLGRPLTEW